jgi:acetyl-CoA C-acetyltransferase
MNEALIVAARRTPIGSFQGALSSLSASDLGAVAARAVVAECNVPVEHIESVIFGCVLQAGVGQGPARQMALAAGIPPSVPSMTINKLCGSGMQSVMLGCDQIRAGTAEVVLAGGLESMSNAPYLLLKARQGYRMGHDQLLDHMYYDALLSPYDGQLMGCFADATAQRYDFTRAAQDDFAAESVRRAMAASEAGEFVAEIAPVTVKDRKGERVHAKDETPYNCDISKIRNLRAAFSKDGTVTAASSSSISDGAAAVLLTTRSAATRHGLQPMARIVAHASFAREPEWFTLAPVGAIKTVLAKADWQARDVDLFEINEAFACVTMAAMRDLDLPHAKVNVDGGACALGHPVGATGARILTTLVHALRRRGGKRGVAALCIGGGEATAIAIELI